MCLSYLTGFPLAHFPYTLLPGTRKDSLWEEPVFHLRGVRLVLRNWGRLPPPRIPPLTASRPLLFQMADSSRGFGS